MKKKRIFIINCIVLASLVLFYFLCKIILEYNAMTFMNIVINSFISLAIILLAFILIQVVIFSYKYIKKKYRKIKKRIVGWTVISVCTISLITLLVYGSLGLFSTYKTEHIIEKDGKSMVAYVDSFMEVNVNY